MARQFEIVKDDEPLARQDHSQAIDTILLGLRALSQRAMVALSNLFTLLTVGSCFWLFMSIPEPNTFQLVQLGMYGAFVLAVNVIVQRGK